MPKDSWKKENNRAKYGQTRSRYPKLVSEKSTGKGKKKKRKQQSNFITRFIKNEVDALDRIKVAKKYVREKVIEKLNLGEETTETRIQAEIKKERKKLKEEEVRLKAKLEIAKKEAINAEEEKKEKKKKKKAKKRLRMEGGKEAEKQAKLSQIENSPGLQSRQKKKSKKIRNLKIRLRQALREENLLS